MKNLFNLKQTKNVLGALFMLCMMFTTQSYAQRTLQETKVAVKNERAFSKRAKITITLDIGRKSKDCTRFGVCKITIGIGLRASNDGENGNSVVGFVNPNFGKKLVIEVPKKGLSRETLKTYFSSDVFIVEEDFSTDKAFFEKTGLQYKIPRGVYDIVDQGDSFLIIF